MTEPTFAAGGLVQPENPVIISIGPEEEVLTTSQAEKIMASACIALASAGLNQRLADQ